MEHRFLDIYKLAKEDSDFVMRRMKPGTNNITVSVVAAFVVLLLAVLNLENIGNATLTTVVISVFLTLVAFTFLYMSRIREVVVANEFENALFCGAMNAGALFSLIISRNKHIIYTSPSYQQYFSQNAAAYGQFFVGLLSGIGLSADQREKLLSAFNSHELVRIDYDLKHDTAASGFLPLTLVLEPIERPSGYFTLRAFRRDGGPKQAAAIAQPEQTPVAPPSTLMEELPWGGYVAAQDGRILYANARFSEMLGFLPGEMAQTSVGFQQLLFGGEEFGSFNQRWQGTVALKNKKGEPVKLFLKQILIHGADGKTTRYGFASRSQSGADVEAPKAEAAGASAPQTGLEELWRHFMDASPVAMALLDEKGLLLRTNAAFRTLTRKPAITLNEPLTHYILPDDRGSISALMDYAKSGIGGSKRSDIRLQGDTQNTVSLYINQLPNANAADKEQMVAYLIDTTEQKSLEQRFVQAQKMQAVGQLAGGIAHDFNNLLTAMIGFCDLLLIRHPAGDQSFADIMQVKQNATRAANLVRQLLAFSRKQTLQPKITNVTDILAELSNLVRRLIGENIELRMKHGRDVGLVKVDQVQLEQVIINLAVNARDAMQGGGALTIETNNVVVNSSNPIPADMIAPAQDEIMEDGDYVKLEITDTGHGIPRAIITQIFEPFFTTKEVGSGTGLGLATVYGIIRQTGGHIFVKSVENQGTTFAIYLKDCTQEAQAQQQADVVDPEKLSAQDLTGAGTILLVEDEAPVRIFSARALRNKGYTVLEADTGEAALHIVNDKGSEIDLIITDVVMPGVTGPAMIENVLKSHPNVEVIFISGYAEDAFVKTFGSERKFNFLPKPFTLKQLASKAKDVMTERQARKASEPQAPASAAPINTAEGIKIIPVAARAEAQAPETTSVKLAEGGHEEQKPATIQEYRLAPRTNHLPEITITETSLPDPVLPNYAEPIAAPKEEPTSSTSPASAPERPAEPE